VEKLKAAVLAVVVAVVGGSLTALIGFYAGLLYQSSIPISTQLNTMTVPNPLASRVFEGKVPKPVSDLLGLLPSQMQGTIAIFNIVQVTGLDITNTSDARTEPLELLLPDSTAIGYYIDANKQSFATQGPVKLGTLNPGETMHVTAVGAFVYSERQFSLLLNGKRVPIEGPLDKTHMGIVPILTLKYPSLVSILLLVAGFVLLGFSGLSIQQAYFRRSISSWAANVSIEELQAYRKLMMHVEKSDPSKFTASTPPEQQSTTA
jgi:hypothetical protein